MHFITDGKTFISGILLHTMLISSVAVNRNLKLSLKLGNCYLKGLREHASRSHLHHKYMENLTKQDWWFR